MPIYLLKSHEIIRSAIKNRISKGHELEKFDVKLNGNKRFEEEVLYWNDFNVSMLKEYIFSDVISSDYDEGYLQVLVDYNSQQHCDAVIIFLSGRIRRLEAVYEKIELYDLYDAKELQVVMIDSNKVFIVHGHDTLAKSETARLLEKLGFEAIILHEKPNEGKTIIEKFEAHADDVGFAIILLTPDDLGEAKDKIDNPKPRARQNVVLELGFFIGKLGRGRVAVLHKGHVELPSDIMGVVYTEMDMAGRWQFDIAKEMKAAGYSVDLNRL